MRQPDIETAIYTYHRYIEIGNKEISALFDDKIGSATIVTIKKAARQQMLHDGVRSATPHAVNTKSAFKAWGFDILDLEKRYEKLVALGFAKERSK